MSIGMDLSERRHHEARPRERFSASRKHFADCGSDDALAPLDVFLGQDPRMAAANGFAFILTGDEFAAPIRDPAHGLQPIAVSPVGGRILTSTVALETRAASPSYRSCRPRRSTSSALRRISATSRRRIHTGRAVHPQAHAGRSLAERLLGKPHNVERAQRLGSAQLDRRVRCARIFQNGNGEFRDILKRDPADLVVSRAINLHLAVGRIETAGRAQPHLGEERRLEDQYIICPSRSRFSAARFADCNGKSKSTPGNETRIK